MNKGILKSLAIAGAIAAIFFGGQWVWRTFFTQEEVVISRPQLETEYEKVTLFNENEVISRDYVYISTDVLNVVIDPVGAMVKSYQVILPNGNLEPVEMVLSQGLSIPHPETGEPVDRGSFLMWWGGNGKHPIFDLFNVDRVDQNTVRFYRDYIDLNGNSFTLSKTYQFQPGEYMMKMDVEMRSSDSSIVPVVFPDGRAFSLEVGPQMGPVFEKIDNHNEVRKFLYKVGNDRKEHKQEDNPLIERATWAGMVGRYFQSIVYTDGGNYHYFYDHDAADKVSDLRAGVIGEGEELTRFNILKNEIETAVEKDTFYFYIGPRDPKFMDIYKSSADNGWNLSNTHLQDTVENNPILGWLVWIFKSLLVLINDLVGNWGIAIIILTFIIKGALFPLTAKFYKSTAAMQNIQPKIKEIQEKYKEDPTTMNQRMFALYQKEGVNPLGGCLPMLLQMPILFAMFDMFRNHFDLRGAMFIPGWIEDLSRPDVIWDFSPFTIPVLGWTALRILPFLMVGTQILTSVMTQKTTASANPQGKWLTYLLPLVFFFFFYNQPSGLVIYWTLNNVITAVQQHVINKTNKKPAAPAVVKRGRKR